MPAEVKDVDIKSRTVTGYFSRFGNVDSDGDMIVPGAFVKTIKERGMEGKNLIVHLADHLLNTANLLAKPKLSEKADGGFFESTFTDTTKAIDVLKLYRDGVVNQHSFGFKTIKDQIKAGFREIQETMIYEISTVVLGANELTPFTGFKSLSKPQLIDQYKLLTKAFKDGDYTDDTFLILEAQIKQLEKDIIEKALTETTEPETVPTQPEVKGLDVLSLATVIQSQSLTIKNLF